MPDECYSLLLFILVILTFVYNTNIKIRWAVEPWDCQTSQSTKIPMKRDKKS